MGLLLGLAALLSSCIYGTKVIGYIPTDPVSIPAPGMRLGSLLLSVSDIPDSMRLSADGQNTYVVRDVRHTVEGALDQAFCATAARVETVDGGMTYDYTLRLIGMACMYRPMGYYADTRYSETTVPLRGKELTSTTTEHRTYSIDTEYKAVLYKADSMVAVFGDVVNSPGTWDMQANLKKAMERTAEHLNSDVVQFLLGGKQQ